MTVDHATKVVLACCVLHNFLRTKTLTTGNESFADVVGDNGTVVDGRWRDDRTNVLPGARRSHARNPPVTALGVRGKLIDYFKNAGHLDWQDAYVRRT